MCTAISKTNQGNNFRATRRQIASPIKTNYQYQTCHLGYKQCINTKQHAKVCRGLAFMVDFVKIRLLLIKTNICRRLLGKQLLRMRCSCSKTRSGSNFSANPIFKVGMRASVYVKIVDRSISMADDHCTASDNETRYWACPAGNTILFPVVNFQSTCAPTAIKMATPQRQRSRPKHEMKAKHWKPF